MHIAVDGLSRRLIIAFNNVDKAREVDINN
jgi:hypothetical protein